MNALGLTGEFSGWPPYFADDVSKTAVGYLKPNGKAVRPLRSPDTQLADAADIDVQGIPQSTVDDSLTVEDTILARETPEQLSAEEYDGVDFGSALTRMWELLTAWGFGDKDAVTALEDRPPDVESQLKPPDEVLQRRR